MLTKTLTLALCISVLGAEYCQNCGRHIATINKINQQLDWRINQDTYYYHMLESQAKLNVKFIRENLKNHTLYLQCNMEEKLRCLQTLIKKFGRFIARSCDICGSCISRISFDECIYDAISELNYRIQIVDQDFKNLGQEIQDTNLRCSGNCT